MRRRVLLAVTFAVTFAVTCLQSARADAAPRATSTRPEVGHQAQQWFARGVTAARAGDHLAARRAFATAYSLVPSVDILWNLAAAERLSGDSLAALQHVRAYVAAVDARIDRKRLAEDEIIPELESQTARLRIDEPEGTVVLVDGKEVSHAATLDVAPGVHAVQTRRPGEAEARDTAIDAATGITTTFGHAPQEDRGAKLATTPVTVAAGPIVQAPVPPPLAPVPAASDAARASARTATVLTLGGIGLAAIATGVVFAVVAREDQADADRLEVRMRDDDRTCKRAATLCSDYDSATSAAQRSMLLSSTMLATGGLMSGAAIAAWILWPTSTTRIVPVAGKDVAGIGVSGRF